MELNEQDISQIEAFLEGRLKGPELESFQARMSAEPEFAEEVEMQKDIVRAVKAGGKAEMAAMLAGIQTEMAGSPQLKKYKPSKGGGSRGGRFVKFLFKLLITAAILGGAYYLAKEKGWLEQLPTELESILQPPSISKSHTETHEAETTYYINGKKSTHPPEIPEGYEVETEEHIEKETRDTISNGP